MTNEKVAKIIWDKILEPISEDLVREIIRSAQKRAAQIIADAKARAEIIEDEGRQHRKPKSARLK
jgi:vacuolar-type H+-ATPase subunit E/Vma4